jgi:hypothetical protein
VSPEIGSHSVVAIGDFLEKYREVSKKLEVLEGYPSNDAILTKDFDEK